MDQYFMVNWTQARVEPEYMLVARKVAVQMLTDIIEDTRINFSHDLCAGRLKRGERGVFGNIGGTFFEVDFGEHNGKPHQATFFVPRRSVHLHFDDTAIVTVQRYDAETGAPVGYAEDVDVAAVNRGPITTTRTYSN